jgi:hypothetical protein
MAIEFLKNPIVLGMVAAILTYIYFHWKAEQDRKKNPDGKKKKSNFLYPGIAGVLVWFLTSSYFETGGPKIIEQVAGYEKLNTQIIQAASANASTVNKIVESDIPTSSHSYHYVGKNKVRLPPTDVFIDIARFE